MPLGLKEFLDVKELLEASCEDLKAHLEILGDLDETAIKVNQEQMDLKVPLV